MRKGVLGTAALLSVLAGCQPVEKGRVGLWGIYGMVSVLSLVLLAVCCRLVNRDKPWFVLLFSSVTVVNTGYFLLAVSGGLEMALAANRLAYLGSVLLPLSMLVIILNVTNTPRPPWLPYVLFGLAAVIFLIAASPGILDIYYKEVSFRVINGVGTLVKVYGPLHPLYLLYLLGYFAAMVAVIWRASAKKRIDTAAHAMILAIAVLVNIGVWLIEQLTHIEFEMLSVSYIISELFLLGLHLVMRENQRLREVVRQAEKVSRQPEGMAAREMLTQPLEEGRVDTARMELYMQGLEQLTPTERAVYEAHVARVTTKEIMASLSITENTLKYHNKNLYGKLGVSSRKELQELYKQIQAISTHREADGEE